MEKRTTGRSGPLTPTELRQRQEAGKASGRARHTRHQAETTPSIRQGSTGDPSPGAVGLFRAGQVRPDTRARRGPWDTRTTEPTTGRIQAEVRFHFPKAYRSETPEPPQKGRPLLARTLGRIKPRRPGQIVPHQAVVVHNPQDMIEAQRHPEMRAIVQHTVNVVRDHQHATIERGRERGLIPEGVRPSTVVQAYRHAALKAMHKAGLIDYRAAPMDQTTKRELRPLNRFMFYAHRRVFDHLNQGPLQGKWDAFRQEFGQLYRQRKYGKYTGHERMRMRPDNEFIKLSKGLGGMIGRVESAIDRPLVRTGLGATGLSIGGAGYLHNRNKKPRPTKEIVYVPEPPGGVPRIAGAHLHVRDAAKHVEGHFAVPKIGGGTRKTASGLYRILPAGELGQVRVPGGEARQDLAKLSLGFTLGDPNPTDDPFTADQPNIDPARQLRRAMRPRIRRKKFRMRLNTQRHLRHVLSGGITRQERWQLGATSRPFKSTALKMEKAYILHPVAAAGFGAAYGTAMGAELHAKRRQGETKAHHEKRQVRAALQGAAIGGGTLGLAAQWEHQNRQNNRMRYATGGYTHRSKTNGKPTVDETWQRGARKLRNKSPVWPKREPWASPMARLTGPKPTIGSRLGNLGRAAVRVAQHIRKQEDMTKGIIGASMRFGATELPKIAGAFARASHTGGAMIARTPIGRMGARLAAKPRVAAGLGAVREGGWKGAFSSPGYTAGNVAGHVIGGSRGRKIGSVLGTAGLTAEYFPDVYTAGHLSGALGDKQPKKPLRPPGQLRKAIAGSVINAMGHTGDFAIRAARRHKLATGIAAGLAIPSAYHAMKDHPDVRALTGAAAAGGAAALLSRGRALRAARQTSQAIYRTGLKDAVRQHAHVMAGGTPSPHLQAQARRVYNTVKGQALMRARAHRRTAIAGIRTPKLKVAGAAAAGAGIGAAIHERHTMPPLYQLAERQE